MDDNQSASPAIGDNSQSSDWGGVSADRLRNLVERIERLEEERRAISGDIKDIYTEAKSAGFDPKVLRQIISIRQKDPSEVLEQDALLEVYKRALGMG